jgi:hypothetical protein
LARRSAITVEAWLTVHVVEHAQRADHHPGQNKAFE